MYKIWKWSTQHLENWCNDSNEELERSPYVDLTYPQNHPRAKMITEFVEFSWGSFAISMHSLRLLLFPIVAYCCVLLVVDIYILIFLSLGFNIPMPSLMDWFMDDLEFPRWWRLVKIYPIKAILAISQNLSNKGHFQFMPSLQQNQQIFNSFLQLRWAFSTACAHPAI